MCTVALKGELRVIQMGDLTADAYFCKTESIVSLFNDLGSSMTDEDVVTYPINGLSEKYTNLATIIAHKDPFPDLDTMRSMVITEEMRLNSRPQPLSTNTSSSAPQVLLAEASNNRGQNNGTSRNNRTNSRNFDPQVCRNFARGVCFRGNTCRFIHDSQRGTSNYGMNRGNNNPSNNARRMPGTSFTPSLGPSFNGIGNQQQLLALIQAQQSLLAQYGLGNNLGQPLSTQQQSTPSGSRSSPPGFGPVLGQQLTNLIPPAAGLYCSVGLWSGDFTTSSIQHDDS